MREIFTCFVCGNDIPRARGEDVVCSRQCDEAYKRGDLLLDPENLPARNERILGVGDPPPYK